MNKLKFNNHIKFQKSTDNGITWTDYYSCHAYINGLSGNEFYIASAGYDASLSVEIYCRYCSELLSVIPTTYRAVEGSTIYELTAPADDIKSEHRELKFRAKRVYS